MVDLGVQISLIRRVYELICLIFLQNIPYLVGSNIDAPCFNHSLVHTRMHINYVLAASIITAYDCSVLFEQSWVGIIKGLKNIWGRTVIISLCQIHIAILHKGPEILTTITYQRIIWYRPGPRRVQTIDTKLNEKYDAFITF